jgi:6-phosphofructokinase 1
MAGKTGLVIGFIHQPFIHVPNELLATHAKRLDPASGWWRSVLAATGQPAQFGCADKPAGARLGHMAD